MRDLASRKMLTFAERFEEWVVLSTACAALFRVLSLVSRCVSGHEARSDVRFAIEFVIEFVIEFMIEFVIGFPESAIRLFLGLIAVTSDQ